MRFITLYISLPFSAKHQREITKIFSDRELENPTANYLIIGFHRFETQRCFHKLCQSRGMAP